MPFLETLRQDQVEVLEKMLERVVVHGKYDS